MNFDIDQTSFFIGFAAGIVTMIMFQLLKPTLKELNISLKSRVSQVQSGLSESIEARYRQDIVGIAQNNHIASPLFSLDEIGIPVKLMAPPPRVIPGEELPPDDTFSLTLPYMPNWPEMAAIYNAPTLSMESALEGGVDLVIIGKAGSGKTFALNQLATRIARRDLDLGTYSEFIPVIVHVGDMQLPPKKGNLLEVLYNALYEKVSAIVEAQLQAYLEDIFQNNKAVLMIDGLDELAPEELNIYLDFIVAVKMKYPKTPLILAGSPDLIPQRDELDLFVIPMAAWDTHRRSELIDKWAGLWNKYIVKDSWAKHLPDPIDPILINGWLNKDPSTLNPLYLTLKLWAIYAGDVLGPEVSHAFDSYVRRMTGNVANSRRALEQLASQIALTASSTVERKKAGKFVAQFEDPSAPYDLEEEILEDSENIIDIDMDLDEIDLEDDDFSDLDDIDIPSPAETLKPKEKNLSARGVRRMLPEMVENQLLTYRSDAKIGFAHPAVGGYLAGCGLASIGGENEIASQPDWLGKKLSLKFLASHRDVSTIAKQMIANSADEQLRANLLQVAEWPSITSSNAPWKNDVLKALAATLNEANLALGLRGRVLTALAVSGEVGMAPLFRQMLSSEQPGVQLLGALGSGIIKDAKAANILNALLYSAVPNIRRAACLALVSIDTTESIEMVAAALLQGEDDARRAAAEALGQHPEEGHPILKEGASLEDLSVRRAVTFGLAWVKEPWAKRLLEKLQLEDEQWIVRTAAGQVLDALSKPNQFIPKPAINPEDSPWLITFASERDMGLAPGKPSWDMLKLALTEGNEDQRLAAMEYYRAYPKEAKEVMFAFYNFLNGNDAEMREAAYQTLWQIQGSGISIDER